jgi:hypothetical protein
MESRIKTLLDYGNHLFEKKQPLDSLMQEIADNFYPERADFTTTRSLGQDFAANLVTSYPLLCRRDLGNSFSGMLRPNNIDWFAIHTQHEEREDNDSKRWLEWATGVQKRAMYARPAQFIRATKEGDHDFAGFGQCVLSLEMNRTMDDLLYRCWHIRDVAWCEGYDGTIDEIHRKWKPTAVVLDRTFKGNVSPKVKEALTKDPYQTFEVRHVVLPSDRYEKKFKQPYVSIFFEVDSGHILEEVGSFSKKYIIPRWQTVSGSQYAYSPATVAALPDARLIQAMTLVLLEAGEKAVNPPLIATQEVIRSDVQMFAGGITWADAEYDERMGEVLRPMAIKTDGIPLGMEMRQDIQEMIQQAFYLNKLNLPIMAGDMTATEVSQRVQEYIRTALPLFEPMEMDYNGALCEETFNLMLRNGAFGRPEDMPKALRGQEIQFRFESPLHQAIERKKGQTWIEAKALLADAAALDPTAAKMIDVKVALRDTLDGIGVPAKWVRSEEQMEEIDIAVQQQQQSQQLLATLTQGGAAAEQIGKAGQALGISQ